MKKVNMRKKILFLIGLFLLQGSYICAMEKEKTEIELKQRKDSDEKETNDDSIDQVTIKKVVTRIEKIDHELDKKFSFNKTSLVSFSLLLLLVFMNVAVFDDHETGCKLKKALWTLLCGATGYLPFFYDCIFDLSHRSTIQHMWWIDNSHEPRSIRIDDKIKEISDELQTFYSHGVNCLNIIARSLYFMPLALVYLTLTGGDSQCEFNWNQALLRMSPLLLFPLFGFINFAKDAKIQHLISNVKKLIDNNKNNEKGEHA